MNHFFGYENWRAHGHRITVHLAECSYSSHGRGAAGGTRSDNGKWHDLGSHAGANDALAQAKRITGAPTVTPCSVCLG